MVIGAGCAERVSATGTMASEASMAATMKLPSSFTGWSVTSNCPTVKATKFTTT